MLISTNLLIDKLRYQNKFIYLHSENECIMELFKGKNILELLNALKQT